MSDCQECLIRWDGFRFPFDKLTHQVDSIFKQQQLDEHIAGQLRLFLESPNDLSEESHAQLSAMLVKPIGVPHEQ